MIIKLMRLVRKNLLFIMEILILMLGYLGVLIVFVCFDMYKSNFSKATKIGKYLQIIGKRTLDVYMIHYFLLPHLPELGNYFKIHSNLVLELFLGLILSFMIVTVSILISNILRSSNIIGYYLLGGKKY